MGVGGGVISTWKASRRGCRKVEPVKAEPEEARTVKAPVVFPSPIVTLGSTPATFGLLLDSVITAPPGGAGSLKVTVPSEVPPTLILRQKSLR